MPSNPDVTGRTLFEFSEPLLILGGWLAAASVLTFVLSLLLLPVLVKNIPTDYFLRFGSGGNKNRTPYQLLLFLIKNLFGLILLAAGILMLFLPGQGLITIFLALLLLDYPGKKRLVFLLSQKPQVQKPINWLRKKVQAEPLRWPPAD
ncbi:MAG: hypothetical protein CSB23_04105 [Deltaproteobacteria bacterium]|nr:MAG: hypothetical protein CSB23_04105 [Deltaproteobacteria bacterium]